MVLWVSPNLGVVQPAMKRVHMIIIIRRKKDPDCFIINNYRDRIFFNLSSVYCGKVDLNLITFINNSNEK